jgi:hypothetical protein
MFSKNNNFKIQKFFYKGFFYLLVFFVFATINTNFAKASTPTDVYRFWSDTKQGHFFTASEDEKNYIIANYPTTVWKYEGVAFQVYATQETGTVPVYRFWSDTKQGHFYTASEEEKNYIIANYPTTVWKYEGIAWYAYSSAQTGTAPVYRFWSDEKQHHFFTFNTAEKTCIQNSYPESTWKYESVAYWVPGIAPPDDPDATCGASLGPMISVGIWSAPRADVRTDPFKIKSVKPYYIKDSSGTIIAQIPANTTTKIEYDADGNLKITDSVPSPIIVGSEVTFEAQNSDNVSMIFSLSRTDFISADYRGRFKFRYSPTSQKVWAINILPIEQYVWGMGEIKGTGPTEYNKVMTTSFRTYGYFWLYESTANLSEGFIVDATPGNQLYKGYDYEVAHPRIKEAAQMTRGNILTSPQSSFEDKVAITPYSSWDDGKTRNFPDGHWGGVCKKSQTGNVSSYYPWLLSVSDPYGKHPSLSTCPLADGTGGVGFNHMVGMSANGALNLAGSSYNWSWDRILKYYFTETSISQIY